MTLGMKNAGAGRERRRPRGATASAVTSAAIASALLLAGCSGSSGGSSSPTPAGSTAAPAASTAAPATTSPAPVAAAPFGTDITAPGGAETYTAAFPAGADGRSTILVATDGSDSPGVVLQPIDPAGTAGAPTSLEGTDTSAACGAVATTLDGVAAVSTLYFEKRAAQGVVPAEYDAYLDTWDGTHPVTKTLIALHVQGVPTCANPGDRNPWTGNTFSGPYENQWAIDGVTDSRTTVAVSYLPAHAGKDPKGKDVFVAIDTGKVTPIALPGEQFLHFVVGAGVLGTCGDDPMGAKPCARSADGKVTGPRTVCEGSANCTYSNLYGSDGLALLADHPDGVQSSNSIGKVLDPLTGAVRFTTGDVPYPDAAVYDKETGTIVVYGDHSLGTDDNLVAGFDATSGKKLWSVPVAKLCGANASGVLVVANGQLAVLSPRDGKQIVSTDRVHDCTPGFGAGIAITGDGLLVSLLAG